MQHRNIILHLSLIDGIGPNFIYKLLKKIDQAEISSLYSYQIEDFISLGCAFEKAQVLVQGLFDKALLQKELELVGKHQVSWLTIFCEQYPKLLQEIEVPPLVLYYQGDVSLFKDEKKLACVGARKAHRYAYESLQLLVSPLIQHDWVIVSGGALGADSFAHQLTLDLGGKTIVVVGSGLCFEYPSQNKLLFSRVVQSRGLIVSCFSMATPPEPHCFPIRNRIISGLALGCLVLQAAQKSGALITAEFAMEQGREVFAVPGSLLDPLSVGCHKLIQQGAKLVTQAQDILDEFAYVETQLTIAQDGMIQDIDNTAHLILQYALTPITADMLLSKLNIGMVDLQNKLFDLSLEGKIAQDSMGLWKRI